MPVTPVGAGAPSIFVSSSAELEAAYETLSTTNGGGTILISSDAEPGLDIDLSGGGSQPVVITSANPDDPSTISRIDLSGVDNLKVTGVKVDSSDVDRPEFFEDLLIANSSRIELSNIDFQSTAEGFFDPADGVPRAETLGLVRQTEDFTFSDNTVKGYYNGISHLEVSGVRLTGNEFSEMQADGVRFAGAENIDISDNHFHTWYASTNAANHDDMIQFWTHQADIVSNNVNISGNILDTTDGGAVQGIFLGNEQVRTDPTHLYRDFTITDNVVYTGMINGIALFSAENVEVARNTILWNENAETFLTGTSDGLNFRPSLRLERIENGNVYDNISSNYILNGDIADQGNFHINYRNPNDPDYIDNHFVGARGGDVGLDGLQLLPDSPWVGSGSPLSQPGVDIFDPAVRPDRPDPVVEPEPVVEEVEEVEAPVVVEQTQTQAPVTPVVAPVVQTPAEPNEELADVSPTGGATPGVFVTLDFENGLADGSAYNSEVDGSVSNIEDGFDGQGYQIGGRDHFTIERSNDHIHELDSFAFEMDIQLNGDIDAGRFVNFYRVFEARLLDDGTLQVQLDTDEGRFVIQSDGPVLTDGEMHTISVGYDDAAGEFSLAIDNEVHDTVAASGTTAPQLYWGLTIGDDWGQTVDATVDNVYFGDSPRALGFDFGEAVETAEEPVTPVTPVTPVVPESPVEDEVDEADEEETVDNTETPTSDLASTLFSFDFEEGLVASEGEDVDTRFGDASNLVDSKDGTGLLINGNEDKITIGRSVDELHSMDSFGFSLDLNLLDADEDGRFARFYQVFEGRIEEDLSVSFTLETDEGTFTVNSGDPVFGDGMTRTLAFGYDNEAGKLALSVDGVVVDYTDASGVTAEQSFFGVTLGDDFHEGPEAVVDNVRFTDTAEGVGIPINEDMAVQGLFRQPIPTDADIAAIDAAEDEDEDDFLAA